MIKAFWLFQISNCDFVYQGHTDRHEQFGSPGHKLGPSTTEDGPGVSPDRLKLQECGLSNTSILITECDGWKVVRPSFDNYLLYEFAKGIFTLLCYIFNEIIQGTSWESNRRKIRLKQSVTSNTWSISPDQTVPTKTVTIHFLNSGRNKITIINFYKPKYMCCNTLLS